MKTTVYQIAVFSSWVNLIMWSFYLSRSTSVETSTPGLSLPRLEKIRDSIFCYTELFN